MPHTYILKTSKNTYYVGSTENIDKKLKEHQLGKVKSTKDRLPVELVFKEYYLTKSQAQKKNTKLKIGKAKRL